MDVSLDGLFNRFVNERQGSYCFGQNGLLLEVLRGLGFRWVRRTSKPRHVQIIFIIRAYAAAARVNGAPVGSSFSYGPLTHTIILAQPCRDSKETYLVDAGFGSYCITAPILLSNHPNNIIVGLSETERHRLTRTPRPDSSLCKPLNHQENYEMSSFTPFILFYFIHFLAYSQDLASTAGQQWNMEVWHKKPGSNDGTWHLQYSFSEFEIYPTDIHFNSYGVSTRPTTTNPFWGGILCIKFGTVDNEETLHLDKSRRPMYRITLYGKKVWKSHGSDKEVLRILETELDRIRAIRDYFGIHLKDEDAVHIIGRPAAYQISN
jgi:hypothetical protein